MAVMEEQKMSNEHKKYEARKTINCRKPDLFGEVFEYLHEKGAMHGLCESYKSYDDGFWSVYHLKLDDVRYDGLKMILVSKPENEEEPERSDLVVTMIAEGENAGEKLADIIQKFNFKEIV